MSNFYNYDTRGASAASQIINLERMVEERDAEIERLQEEYRILKGGADLMATQLMDQDDEIERLRAQLALGEVGAKALADAKEEISRLLKKD